MATSLDATLTQIEADIPNVKAKMDKLASDLAAAQAMISTSMTPDQVTEVQNRLTAIETALKGL